MGKTNRKINSKDKNRTIKNKQHQQMKNSKRVNINKILTEKEKEEELDWLNSIDSKWIQDFDFEPQEEY